MKLPLSRLFLLFLLLLSSISRAQSPAGNGKSLLWQISSDSLKKPSYLLGTIHLICREDLIWTPAMKRTLQSADEICLEMDMDDPSLMMEVAVGLVDNSGKKLSDHFTEEQYRNVSAFIRDSMKMDISMFQQFKPVAIQTLLATKAADCPDPMAYETLLTDEAKKQKKEVVGLEAVSEQLALLNDVPTDSVVADLVETAADGFEEQREKFRTLVRLYKAQDLPALHKYIQDSKDDIANLDAFLDVRNEKWISRMTERMEAGSVFFAVGAGHLWGEKGLITLLRKAGYKVVPVR
jgi:uncharacterized protein YbaP (TraB family)